MPQSFVLETNRYTASPQASTAISNNGSNKVRYAYNSHPYQVGDVITGSLFGDESLNVRQTVTDIAANTFDTSLDWSGAFSGLTGTVTRTNDNMMVEVQVKKAGVTVSSGYYVVNSSGRVQPHVNDILLKNMEPTLPSITGGAVLDTGLFLAYSIYAREVFDDVEGIQKTGSDYTSGTYYAAYGHRVYNEARTTAAFMMTLTSAGRLLRTKRTVVIPMGTTLMLSGLVQAGAGITSVQVRADETPTSTKTGTAVSTADAAVKVTAPYGPDIYGASATSANVYLYANGTTRISDIIEVRFAPAICEGAKFMWLNNLGGWEQIAISHFKREDFTASEKEIAWKAQSSSYTVGDAFKRAYHIQANIGFRVTGQVPQSVAAARDFARITESELVYAIEDGVLIPIVLDTQDMTYIVKDEIVYFTIECIYAYNEI